MFRKGKRKAKELDVFEYSLEQNLFVLQNDLDRDSYRHGEYSRFTVTDNKRREISVASVRDRVVHRLLYGFLVEIYDKAFISDVWSCRKGKGLTGAIARTQELLLRYKKCFVWRSDIRKFFDHVDHDILKNILARGISDERAIRILYEVIESYSIQTISGGGFQEDRKYGIPIGNLTSQIFSNIYLNEFDQHVKNVLKPKAYLRYGDDFFIIMDSLAELEALRRYCIWFLQEQLRLSIHPKNDIIISVKRGLKFLGVEIFPKGRRLKKRNWRRALERSDMRNISSYSGIVREHCNKKKQKEFQWMVLKKLEDEL